ncbi:uncharacterized protein C8Q71DRAFT_784974 [Rhodofomes roseus]|uniref:F-box domain-containing protein n=1 Tax=Rhodofomes roseus TaxID=34475 RepID=A0ABQ8K284_9APHY|nr:uncharacterized protein C8Q71DRAFT_784974 [Rhodofomes roseus]KAH9830575.1 hypothetical protein C8Q71DRAFT_784974 [Rhodofomes roseus]
MPQLSSNRAPPEIWQEIISHLPRASIRTCRLVSQAFNGLSMGMALSCITISLGIYDPTGALNADGLDWNPRADVLEVQAYRTSAVLDRITSEPSFARGVKRLHVYVFDEGLASTHWIHRLVAAIRSLSQLRCLVWIGGDAILPRSQVIDALQTCWPLLGELSIPISALSILPWPIIARLHSITAESLSQYSSLYLESVTHTLRATLFRTGRPLNIHTLRPGLFCNAPAEFPLPCVPRLRHLDITLTESCRGLGNLLRGIPELESLSVAVSREAALRRNLTRLLVELSSAIRDLPQLTALGIHVHRHMVHQGHSNDGPLSTTEVARLCDALRCCSRLHRLYFNLRITSEHLPTYLSAIAQLRCLDTLHLALEGQRLDAAFFALLRRHLPGSTHSRLVALSLSTTGTLTVRVKSTFRTVTFHKHFKCLRFIQIEVDVTRRRGRDAVVRDMIRDAKNLEAVGYNGNFYDVRRNRKGVSVAQGPWSARKVRFGGIEDCADEGCDWLMRHLAFV